MAKYQLVSFKACPWVQRVAIVLPEKRGRFRIPPHRAGAFEKLERALERQRKGPFFNGGNYALIDASYAPSLQRHLFLERIRKIGRICHFPRVKAWAEAIVARPSTQSFPPAEYETMYRDMVKRRGSWISQFVEL